jgi:DNA-binding response OmpR family regulator
MKNLRILVVDDDRDFAEGVADVLRLHGHETALAHSGEEALETFTESEFDVTFMDVKLPGWNGVQSFREFRRRFPGAKVVMMTAYNLDNLMDVATETGVIGSFHKPLAFGEVEALLNRVRQDARVLIVDDDVDFAREIRDVLEVAGFSVRSCFDGQTAIQRCLEEPFDAMILDLRLPGASGAEVFSAVREARPGLRIVPITGFGQEATESAAHTIDPNRVLHKPFNPDSLLRMLEHAPGVG